MRLHKTISLTLLIIVLLHGCKDGPVEVEEKSPAFYAKVVDSGNNPVADVGLHYMFNDGENVITRNYVFEYGLQSSDSITIKVFDSFANEIATPLNKRYQRAGNYAYNYDASHITNGVYFCTISGSTINQKIRFFVLTDDITQLKTMSPFYRTNQSGDMQIAFSSFGIGNRIALLNGVGDTLRNVIISDSITVILIKQGYRDFTQKVHFDTTKAFEATFTLQSN